MKRLIRKSLFKKNGGHRMEYYDVNGKLKTKQFKTKDRKEAETMAFNFLIEITVQIQQIEHDVEIQRTENKYKGVKRHVVNNEIVNTYKLLLDVYDEFFMIHKEKISKRSFDDYRRLKKLLYDYGFRWEQLEVNSLIGFQNGLKKHLAHHTIANHMVLFAVFIRYCRDCGYISSEVCDLVRMNLVKHEKMDKTPKIPNFVLEEIFKHAKDDTDFALLLDLMYFTGCRPAEIIKLDKNCLVPNTKIIRIYQPKTKKTLQITLSDELYTRCEAHFSLSTTDFAFHHGHKACYYNNKWNAICEKMGLRQTHNGKRKNLYNLKQVRHTVITEEYRKTGSKDKASLKAGHVDPKTTNKYIDPFCDDRQ